MSSDQLPFAAWQPLPEGKEQFPLDYIRSKGVLVLKRDEDSLTLGLSRDSKLMRLELQNHLPDKKLHFHSIDRQELSIHLANSLSQSQGDLQGSALQSELSLDQLEGDAPVINRVNSIIMDAIRQKASDIHIEAFANELTLRYRIDGVLKIQQSLPREQFNALSSRIKIMANLNIMERRLPQDGRISVQMNQNSVDLRVSIVPIAREGESIVLRMLNRSENLLNLDEMGFNDNLRKSLRRIVEHPHGLILVTGPTGSGKTTTLNALLKEIQSEEKKIITIEDPIEYVIPGIDQIQTNQDIGLDFPSLLRRVLRQDPNIIMVGEIRDRETAELAVRAALTGHLVFSTLHTNDSLSVIPRLLDMGVESYLLAAVIKGAMAQRLVRRLCEHCKEALTVDKPTRAIWEAQGLKAPKKVYQARGCDRCSGRGYLGRTALGEIFVSTKELEEAISRGDSARELAEIVRNQGMSSVLQDGLERVSLGETTLSEVEGAVFF